MLLDLFFLFLFFTFHPFSLFFLPRLVVRGLVLEGKRILVVQLREEIGVALIEFSTHLRPVRLFRMLRLSLQSQPWLLFFHPHLKRLLFPRHLYLKIDALVSILVLQRFPFSQVSLRHLDVFKQIDDVQHFCDLFDRIVLIAGKETQQMI